MPGCLAACYKVTDVAAPHTAVLPLETLLLPKKGNNRGASPPSLAALLVLFNYCMYDRNDMMAWASDFEIAVEEVQDATIALANAYAMSENCVTTGPIPQTDVGFTDVTPTLKTKKSKKKKEEDPEPDDCAYEAFAGGFPEGKWVEIKVGGATDMSPIDPYKGVEPW